MNRREIIAGLGSAAAWPIAARAQQPTMPVVALINGAAADGSADFAAAFRSGLSETGYVEGRNVTVEYHWLDSQYDRLPAIMVDLVRRRVAVIATPGSTIITAAYADLSKPSERLYARLFRIWTQAGLKLSASATGPLARFVQDVTADLFPRQITGEAIKKAVSRERSRRRMNAMVGITPQTSVTADATVIEGKMIRQ